MPTLDLESDQRTVLHLAPFFEELQSQAKQLARKTEATERGYFSTREEEATSGLLVSYWHARNALFDLITTLRRATEDRKSTRLNSSHVVISYAVFCLKNKRPITGVHQCSVAGLWHSTLR